MYRARICSVEDQSMACEPERDRLVLCWKEMVGDELRFIVEGERGWKGSNEASAVVLDRRGSVPG